ncbi:unnamed protein product [Arabis nemorensis]|uniref:AIG1-type G domain-containing protein n=1 Tax=Arabis nemorensis TaxID=586526 RepID=A0A565BDQ6_9BRAS|nr:unnamed protein product [Arabis nemorensis]
MIVLFTGADELNEGTLDKYLSLGCPQYLKAIVRMCDGRKVLFDNKTNDEAKKLKQVQELMAHVATIYKNNDGNPLTREM